ncbi:diaminopimelate epimerase [Caldicoprobacter guelmensis]|nr:diaminopimelate epimerase [Caldicoprobacter guelmensis]MBM7582390.1 diaminopimelate epimerase [Caldicoprobacter guelmensis]
MIRFTKMHGLGNDYVYIDCVRQDCKAFMDNLPQIARLISDRHFGVGADGLVLILPSEVADFKMRMFNSDGSEAEMCGNAIRCVGKYVYDSGLTRKTAVSIETLAGVKLLDMKVKDGKVQMVKVDMGQPILEPKRIPVQSDKEAFINEPIDVEGQTFKITCVSMGNPHAVIYVNNLAGLQLEKVGPKIENHPLFPNRVNVEFVQVIDRQTLKVRVWERGAGETMACGTGACAVLVASVLNGLSQRNATVKLLGGDLIIEWNEDDGHVYMTGPAVKVFDGEIDLEMLSATAYKQLL